MMYTEKDYGASARQWAGAKKFARTGEPDLEERMAYLDNAATTRVCDEAARAAVEMMQSCYGNPSSLHRLGAASARRLAEAREAVAQLLGCQPECVYFTSGGSESNNLAILGAAQAKKRRADEIVTTTAEHSSVSMAVKHLEDQGWKVTRIHPGRDGNLDPYAVADAVNERTALVTMMVVNNETGALFPVEEAAALIRQKNPDTLIHWDGVQAFGKLPLKAARMEVDLLSVSGHKIQGPKGSGALYVRRGVRVAPVVYGGGQERGLRSGTEALPALVAMGAAAARLQGRLPALWQCTAALRDSLRQRLGELPQVQLNSPADASPYILNFSVPGYRSENMLHFLESRGVFVSSGSACSKGATSPVLTSMGLPAALVDSALRVSFIYDTQPEELDQLMDALKEGIATVAHR